MLRILIVGGFFWALWHSRQIQVQPASLLTSLTKLEPTPDESDTKSKSLYQTRFIDNAGVDSVHSATLTRIPTTTPVDSVDSGKKTQNSKLMAFWFGGSEEGASDVAIYQSFFSLDEIHKQWSKPTVAFNRDQLTNQLGRNIAKLGNPVAYFDSHNRLWLFLVSVSLGGWSASAVNFSVSDDYGTSWSPMSRLSTSPIFNLGTLVRTPPLELSDGGLLLPAYHETITKFPQIIRLNSEGKIVAIRKIGGEQAIQASLCPANNQRIHSLSRNAQDSSEGRRVLASISEDAGENWSELIETNLENPHSAVVCLRTSKNQLLLVGNRSETERNRLSLAVSQSQPTLTQTNWRWIHDFEQQNDGRFSYPSLIEDGDDFHLLYSWNRNRIKHVRFNHSWLQQTIDAQP